MGKKNKFALMLVLVFCTTALTAGYSVLLVRYLNKHTPIAAKPDPLFGWKFPANTFPLAQPTTGSGKNLFDFQIAYSTIRDPGGIPSGLPVRLKIPIIGVNAAIEDALITPDGRMDVPAGSVNVAWFALGPHPGQIGSAVIGGHYGITNGVPFVFYNLDKLKIGDKVYVENDQGDTLAFIVRSTKSFDRDADATTVFTSSDGLAHLNIITCEGIWNKVNDSYPQRLVVFTDAIPSEGPVASPSINSPTLPTTAITPPKTTPTPTPTPAPSSPTPTPKPSPTPDSLVTGEATQTPLVTEPQAIYEQPASSSSPEYSPPFVPSDNSYIKNLYKTPLDGVISSLLLISIIIVAFKIIRR